MLVEMLDRRIMPQPRVSMTSTPAHVIDKATCDEALQHGTKRTSTTVLRETTVDKIL
jgi:hypothetical protein